ncbi:hypothetical protein CGMCC3_g5701 [Colletotrichum fructicola]|nr:uncharacterized protein CGMCC3_g5701 [Colletotrichum fructicola]KAE9578550.1 hypothetical protein CGMCC3_g5701 [Colletotrichum fructicola]
MFAFGSTHRNVDSPKEIALTRNPNNPAAAICE